MTTAAVIAFCIVLGLLAMFQVALVGGAQLGRFAWGGQHEALPRRLRIGSVIAIVLHPVFGLIVLERAGSTSVIPFDGLVIVASWVLTAYLTLGVILNAISRSKPARYTMTPVTVILAVLALVVASG